MALRVASLAAVDATEDAGLRIAPRLARSPNRPRNSGAPAGSEVESLAAMLRRLLLSLAIALLGLGTVLHGVQASVMGVGMVMAADSTDAPPCGGCDGGTGDPAACGAVCAPGVALPSSPSVQIDVVADARPSGQSHWAESFSGPPDPYPPRS